MPEVDAFMGIDQVAQVGDIVGKAIANRAEKLEETSNIQHPTSNIERENLRAFERTGKEPRPFPNTKKKNPFAARKNSAKPKPS